MVRRGQDGQALVLALFGLVLTLTATALVAAVLDLRLRSVRQQAVDLQLTALCDAAMAQALAELGDDPEYAGTSGAVPFADGTLTIAVEHFSAWRAAVMVEASLAGRKRTAQAVVSLRPPRVISWRPGGVGPAASH